MTEIIVKGYEKENGLYWENFKIEENYSILTKFDKSESEKAKWDL